MEAINIITAEEFLATMQAHLAKVSHVAVVASRNETYGTKDKLNALSIVAIGITERGMVGIYDVLEDVFRPTVSGFQFFCNDKGFMSRVEQEIAAFKEEQRKLQEQAEEDAKARNEQLNVVAAVLGSALTTDAEKADAAVPFIVEAINQHEDAKGDSDGLIILPDQPDVPDDLRLD